MRFAFLAAALSMASPLALDAQQLDSATIVRFRMHRESDVREGELTRLTPDSLILGTCYGCSYLRYARADISGLEVYRGSTGFRNGVLGFLGGAVIGGGIAAAAISMQQCSDDLCGLRYIVVPEAALAGAFVGLLAGISLGKETWEPVP